MFKLITLLFLALNLSIQGLSQITYGKEDCGSIFNTWIEMLNEVKSGSTDTITSSALFRLGDWIRFAHEDVSEKRFRILQENEADGPILNSVINTLHNSGARGMTQTYYPIKFESGKNLSSEEFFRTYSEMPDKNIFQALSVIFNVYSIEKEIKESKESGMDPREVFFRFSKPGETDINADISLNSFYSYLMDIVEYDRVGRKSREFDNVYNKSEDFLTRITGVTPPPFNQTEDVNKYMKQFTWEILYAFNRSLALPANANGAFRFNPTSYPGPFGENRYETLYFKKMFAAYFRSQLSVLIHHINTLKKACAPTNSGSLGKLEVGSMTASIPQEDGKEIEVPKKDPSPGKTWMLLVFKDSKGKYLAKDNIAKLYKVGKGNDKPEYYGGRYLNTYGEVDPGTYLVKYRNFVEDSILINVADGAPNIFSFPEKGSLHVTGILTNGTSVDPVNVRIEKIKQNQNNSLKLDTVFLWLFNNKDQPCDLSAGLYRVGIRMTPNYYPQMHYTDVEIVEQKKTYLELSGYGQLLINSFDGSGKPKRVQVNIFSTIKNPKTNEYTFLKRIEGMDTMNLKPGAYRVQIEYAFPIIREVEISSEYLTEERIDNIGSLTVRKAGSTQWIDIVDNSTQAKTAFRNNATIELQSDRTYTVTIRSDGQNPKRFSDVKILPGQTTTINW